MEQQYILSEGNVTTVARVNKKLTLIKFKDVKEDTELAKYSTFPTARGAATKLNNKFGTKLIPVEYNIDVVVVKKPINDSNIEKVVGGVKEKYSNDKKGITRVDVEFKPSLISKILSIFKKK